MGVGAELLEHLDLHPDRRQPGCERGVLEALGADAEDDRSSPGRCRDRYAVLPEAHTVPVDRARDEVHRRRPDERRDEEVVRPA